MDRYVFLRLLSIGKNGKLYLGFDKVLCKYFAVKELKIEVQGMRGYYLKNAVREQFVKIRTFTHRCLPVLYGVFFDENAAYVVMEYQEGRSLKKLSDERELTAKHLLNICKGLSELMAMLHRMGMVGTLVSQSADNLIVCDDGHIMVQDIWELFSCDFQNCFEIVEGQYLKKNEKDHINSKEYANRIENDIASYGEIISNCTVRQGMSKKLMAFIKSCKDSEYKTADELCMAADKLYKSNTGFRVLLPKLLKGLVGVIILASLCMGVVCGTCAYEKDNMSAEQDNERMQEARLMDSEDNTDAYLYECQEAMMEGNKEDGAKIGKTYRIDINKAQLDILQRLEQSDLGEAELTELAIKVQELGDEIEKLDEEDMCEMKVENLSMLSTIYKMLGRQNESMRTELLKKAASCIEELLLINGVREKPIYRLKLAELVSIKEELGDSVSALSYLESWEKDNPDSGKEFYIAHALILLKEPGNSESLEKLKMQMDEIDEVRKDFRYIDICRRILLYLKEERKVKV